MEKLISSWYNGQTLPESYIFPPDARPGNLTTAPSRDNIPVIDLGRAEGGDQTYTIQKILKAGQEFGFFQIISNGKLKSAEHRAVTSSSHSRTSAAFFIVRSDDCIGEPAGALISASNP